jgi:hypothetical protein
VQPVNPEEVVVLEASTPGVTLAHTCLVRGCGEDVSKLREHHQRYCICDLHCKVRPAHTSETLYV